MKLCHLATISIALVSVQSAAAQQNLSPFTPGPLQINNTSGEKVDEPEDLKQMKRTKWTVTAVERDGQTIPAQYGQRVGDVISFKMDDNGSVIFG